MHDSVVSSKGGIIIFLNVYWLRTLSAHREEGLTSYFQMASVLLGVIVAVGTCSLTPFCVVATARLCVCGSSFRRRWCSCSFSVYAPVFLPLLLL